MLFVYILQSLRDGRYYIGSTKELRRRVRQHERGETHSTKRLGNLELVFSQEYPKLAEAQIIEKKLKRLKRKDYIQKIIRAGYIKIRP